jgi:2-methylcitrate dehydratase PrpD
MATQAQHLAEFAERLKFEDIPSEIIERAKLHILDILGIGLAASDRHAGRVPSSGLLPHSDLRHFCCRYGDRQAHGTAVAGADAYAWGVWQPGSRNPGLSR